MQGRRAFFRSLVGSAAGLLVSRTERLVASTGIGPDDPEVPNQEVARILKEVLPAEKPPAPGEIVRDESVVDESDES